jgi:hypothetical protein
MSGLVDLSISTECSAIIFRVRQSKKNSSAIFQKVGKHSPLSHSTRHEFPEAEL